MLQCRVIWISGVIGPIPGHAATAAVKLVHPLNTEFPVRIWAWWPDGTLVGIRHANPDGSACVYEPGDLAGCWDRGKPLVDLLIMHAVWLIRHVFLIEFDR